MRTAANNMHGFTLIELMIVVLIIGILSSIAIPNFIRMQENGKRASCISNQRQICEQALLYSAENAFTSGVLNVNVLYLGNQVLDTMAECPKSLTDDWDDYNVTFVNNRITKIVCQIEPVDHSYTFHN